SIGFSVSVQIIVIALILLTLPFAILINHYRKKRAAKKEAAAQAAAQNASAPTAEKTPAAPQRIYDELLRDAEEAVQWLRSTPLGGSKASEAVYALPWFVVAGPPSSGKTSLLLSCGLDFHALPSQRRAELKIVRPTRHPEWRMTDSAVWIDTAGRYQSDGPGRDEWLALTETIKKHRANRPLDGLLLVVSADRLLQSNDAAIEQHAKTMRARVDELIALGRTRFPIYLVFTNMDRLSGFAEFFNVVGSDNRAQVWGATIPLEKAANAHALFDVEFDLLRESLVHGRLLRLRQPAAPAAQLRTFVFPMRFTEARHKLGLFTSALFRPNPFSESPLLRGFYFTANLSDVTGPSAVEDGPERSAQAVGEPYFTNRLFGDVVLRDRDLARSFQAAQKRRSLVRPILVAAVSVLLLFLTVGGLVSFLNNRRLISEAAQRGVRVDEILRAGEGADPVTRDPAVVQDEIEAIESLRVALAELDEYESDSPPIQMRFGLYSGNAISGRLREIYFTAIDRRYVKSTVAALKADLEAFAAGGAVSAPVVTATTEEGTGSGTDDVLGRHYDLLKAYLMLAQADKVEPTFLAHQLQEYWKKSSPPNMEGESQRQLEFYAKQAVREDAPHYKADDRLVNDVRQKLVAYPATQRFYKRVITEINTKTTPVTLDAILQGRGGGVLTSVNTVPGSFTIEGYRNYMLPALDSAAEEMSKDDWVMGSVGSTMKPADPNISNLHSMYLREYADQWRGFLKGISVQQLKTPDDVVMTLKACSATDSPMERVIETVVRNTNLSAKEESSGLWAWVKSWFSSASAHDTGGDTQVEKEFRPLFQFATSPNKKDSSPMSEYRAQLGTLVGPIEDAPPERMVEIQKLVSSGKDEIGLQRAEQNIGRLIDFKTPAGADAAAFLKQPIVAVKRFFYGGGYEQIIKEWAEQILPRSRALEAVYPFCQNVAEISLTDLTAFLNPNNGQFTTFFNTRLASSFEGSPGAWRLKDSAPFRFSPEFEKYINDVGRLQEALFPANGKQLDVSYKLQLQSVADADTVITIDNVTVEAHSAASDLVNFNWPAKSGASGARLTVRSGADLLGEKVQTGDWGLFRIFDAGSPRQSATGYELTWTPNSVTVRATLQPASSSKHPFDRRLFTNLRAPQNIEN
ncbi:MAG TPA: type VI secretion system membrane subunit TssM, partial [Pyrinomonadaceae bacterium]|nr:type VI secretion system membrane subunit TssM [Pyrinomonadaceae bacterium]